MIPIIESDIVDGDCIVEYHSDEICKSLAVMLIVGSSDKEDFIRIYSLLEDSRDDTNTPITYRRYEFNPWSGTDSGVGMFLINAILFKLDDEERGNLAMEMI